MSLLAGSNRYFPTQDCFYLMLDSYWYALLERVCIPSPFTNYHTPANRLLLSKVREIDTAYLSAELGKPRSSHCGIMKPHRVFSGYQSQHAATELHVLHTEVCK